MLVKFLFWSVLALAYGFLLYWLWQDVRGRKQTHKQSLPRHPFVAWGDGKRYWERRR